MSESVKPVEKRSFKRGFAALKTLTVMQLKEKMDVSYLRDFKQTLFHVIFFLLEFVAIAAICYLLFFFANFLKVFDMATGRIPETVLATVFAVMMGLSIVFTTIGLVKSLYLSKDNQVLLTLPSLPSTVFLSKLLVYYVYEIRKNFLFLVPLFCAYGLFLGYPIYYFPWIMVFFVFIAAIPVLLAALLSMPALFVFLILKKSKILQYILLGLLFAALAALVFYVVSLLPKEINFLKNGFPRKAVVDITTTVSKWVPPVAWLTSLLLGNPYALISEQAGDYVVYTTKPQLFTAGTFPIAIGLLVSIALLVILCFALSKPLFYKMASKPFEFTKRTKITPKDNKPTPLFLSAVKKEWLISLRDNSILQLIAQLLVIMPLAIVFLNSLYKAMAKDSIGIQMTVAFNFLIIMLFMLSANIRLSSAYSQDGFSAYLNKIQPSNYGPLLFAKLTINIVMGLVASVIISAVYDVYALPHTVNVPLFSVTIYGFFIAHLFWSAELDIMNPQYMQYATFSEQSNNPNENKSSLLVFVISFLAAIAIFLLALESVSAVWIKASLFAVAFAALRIFVFFLKIKVYYKEK